MRIAALDDDPAHLDLVGHCMRRIGHQCEVFSTGHRLMHMLRRESFDLLIVDWQMPELGGPDIVQWVRGSLGSTMPILMLTVRSDERDVVYGLTCGADDYVTKPVRVGELTARVRALLRRTYPTETEQELRFGTYHLNRRERSVHFGQRRIELHIKEFELLWRLCTHMGRILSRRDLMETIWGMNTDVRSRCLDTCIWSIRGKLELRPENGFRITSVYGVGYRLEQLNAELPQCMQ